MPKKIYLLIILIMVIAGVTQSRPEDYLMIDTTVEPNRVIQGEEAILKLKIKPKNGIKISSHPEFMIKLTDNSNLSFSKVFFTASELDFGTRQENDTVYLELEKEVTINFKVNPDALIGKHNIRGEVVFTAVFEDSWSLKTYQKFKVDFISRKNRKIKSNRK